LDFKFFVDVYSMRVCLCIYVLYLDDVIRPWTPTRRAILWLKLLETRL